MGKFRTLITEFRSQSDKDKRFLITHGIDPKALLIPMYYPDKKCNVVLQGPSKDSPWLKDEKVSLKDKVLIRPVYEEYIKPGDNNDTGNYYKKQFGDNIIELTVDEYKEKILNNPENEETQEDMRFTDLSSEENINKFINDLKTKHDEDNLNKKREFEKFVNSLPHFGNSKILNALDLPEKDDGSIDIKTIPNSIKPALEKLKSLQDLGIDTDDEYAAFITWESKNHIIFDIVKQKIKEIKNENDRKEVQQSFKKHKKEWFRSNLDPKNVVNMVNQWWKSLGLSPLSKKQNESVLTEFGSKSSTYLPYTDAKIDSYLDELFGDNGKRFKTVPIINNPYNPDDPDADPVEYLLIRGIDTADLGPNGKVRVGKTDINGAKVSETYEMNIDDLQEIVNRDENQNTGLNTDAYRRKAGNQFNTLNPGYGGKYIELPEEVVMQMLETMQNDEDGDYKYDYTMIDLVKKYKEELKDPNKHSDIVLKALQDYNDYNNRQYQIRYNKSRGKYMGLIEYEGHIAAPIKHTWHS